MEYHSPQGLLLPRDYGVTVSALWLKLRVTAAWQATPSWTVSRLASHGLFPSLQVTFAMVSDAAWLGCDERPWITATSTGLVRLLGCPSALDRWGVVCCALSLCRHRGVRVCGVLRSWHLFTGERILCVLCAVSVATWRLFTDVRAVCSTRVVLVAWLPPDPLFNLVF